MRVRWALPFLLVLCMVPASDAQLPSAFLMEIRLGIPAEPVDPGASVRADVTAKRVCPSPAAVMAEQEVNLFLDQAGIPRSEQPVAVMQFPQHLCGTGDRQDGDASFDFVVPLDAPRGEPMAWSVTFSPGQVEATEFGVRGEQTVPFDLAIMPEPPAPAVVEEPEKESPGLGGIAALLAVAAAAVVLRRRP